MSLPRLFQANAGRYNPFVLFARNKGRVSTRPTATGARFALTAARQSRAAAPSSTTDTQVSPSADAAYQYHPTSTADTGDFTGLPSGWSTPSGGGLELVTQYAVDGLGRDTEVVSPGGNVTYVVYNDAAHEVLIYRGWDSGTGLPTGPTEVTREDRADGYVETFTMSATPHTTGGVPDGTEAVSGLQTLRRSYVNAAGQVTTVDAYFDLSGLTYTTAVMGTAGVNFYQTQYDYDSRGRLARVQAPTGTITRQVYDGQGRLVSAWVGTNDTPASGSWSPTNNTSPSNMVQTAGYVYDGGGVGDGNVTQVTQYPGGTAANRVTQNWYDWRDRPVASKDGVQGTEDTTTHRPITYTTYDNLDEATQVQRYDGDGVTLTVSGGVPQAPSSSLLRAQAATSYDDQGRAYRTLAYDVNPSTGAVTTSLATNVYYNHRGQVMAVSSPGGLWAKTLYDGAGRATYSYSTDGAGGTTWSAAGSVSSDHVLEQTQGVYDADGNVVETVTRQRFDDETALGALGDAGTAPKARVSYAASYYDAADRLTASVDVGTNGGSAWTRPSGVPTGSGTVLVTSYAYNAAGWVQDTTDPRGLVRRVTYDALGRKTKVVQNYTGGTPGTQNDVATEYTYDGDGHTLTVKADEPGGGHQTTQFVYGATTGGGSAVNSNDLLTAVEHPDPTTGNPSSSQQDVYTVNALGQNLTAADRNGNVHTFSYDVLGRRTSDQVTTLGGGVDGSVRRIDTAYDGQGNAYLVTSYSTTGGGTVVNQVERLYNGFGQLTAEYQSHGGAVNTSTTPAVQYAYVEGASGANNSRLVSVTYPSGYVLSYNYASGVDSSISRLTSLSDSGGTLEGYKYLGLGTVVERNHPQTYVNLTYVSQTGSTGDAGDKYVGLDRFGRVVDQNWYTTSTSSSTDRFQYGYDADGNVLYRNNTVNTAFGELYAYDSLNQLTSFQRGTLNGTFTGLVGSASRSQSWTPDALGNFTGVTTDGTSQTSTFNQQNEFTSGSVTYDADGNTTADGTGNSYVYDAWDRLVSVSNGGTTVASYGYDGLGRRVTETHGSTTTDLSFSAGWQVLEEDVGGAAQARDVWSPVYVDALVLRDQSSLHNGTLDQRLYAQQAANWDVTALVSASGAVVERYVYDPYGAVSVLTAGWATRSVSQYGWLYLHQGGRVDPATGQYNFRRRDYSPTLQRWIEVDPSGFRAGDNNLYRAVGNDPLGLADPTGLQGKGTVRIENPGRVYTKEGETVQLRLRGQTQSGTPLIWIARNLPRGVTMDPSTGIISGKPSGNIADVTIEAYDGAGGYDIQHFDWYIGGGYLSGGVSPTHVPGEFVEGDDQYYPGQPPLIAGSRGPGWDLPTEGEPYPGENGPTTNIPPRRGFPYSDYYQFNLGIGGWYYWNGQITYVPSSGRLYMTPFGMGMGASPWPVTASLVGGTIPVEEKPGRSREDLVNSFTEGETANVSAGAVVGAGGTFSPSRGSPPGAVEYGLYTPQAGVTVTGQPRNWYAPVPKLGN
jgi:RHS repeat-associated protein